MSYLLKENRNKDQKQLIESVVQNLVELDKELSPRRGSGSFAEALPDLAINGNQLKAMYRDFIQKFIDVGELEDNVLIYSVCLAKKVVNLAKKNYSFKKGEFVLLYSACLYLSVKMLIDEERWFVADFSYVSGLEECHIQKMEKFVLCDILKFNAKISDEVFFAEASALREPVPKRRRRRFLSAAQ